MIFTFIQSQAAGIPNVPSGGYGMYDLREIPGYSWTGALIKARRSSDNAEADFYQGATAGTLNTTRGGGGTDIATWAGAGNAFGTTWYDQSGSGRNHTQTTAAFQPKIVATGALITKNGLPSFQFGSAGIEIFFNMGFSYQATLSTFVVVDVDNATNFPRIFDTQNGTNSQQLLWDNAVAEICTKDNAFQGGTTSYKWGAKSANLSLITTVWTAADTTLLEIDGVAQTTAAGPAVGNAGTVARMGIRSDANTVTQLDGYISALYAWNADQTSSIADTEANIKDYYALF